MYATQRQNLGFKLRKEHRKISHDRSANAWVGRRWELILGKISQRDDKNMVHLLPNTTYIQGRMHIIPRLATLARTESTEEYICWA